MTGALVEPAVTRVPAHLAGAACPVLIVSIDKLFTDADQFIFGQLQAHLLVGKTQFSQQKGFPPTALDMKNTF